MFNHEIRLPYVISLITILSLLSGCSSPKPVPKVLDSKDTKTENQASETTQVTPDSTMSYSDSLKQQRPIAVMLDNHVGARPQAGLKNADVVVEALAEGNITRYMAIFFGTNNEPVGPIRSARPYFIDRAMEYNAIYTHVGGSPKALSDVKTLKVADLDGLSVSSKVMWRKSHKKMPHNLYSTVETLRNESNRRHYKETPADDVLFYANDEWTPLGDSTNTLTMLYRKKAKNDSGYIVDYKWKEDTKTFQRYVNGSMHTDEIDQTPIDAKNVLIQVVPTRVVDDKGRLDLELVGSGKGYWLTNGIRVPITWKKSSRQAITHYYDADGKDLQLNPGKTWIQIVPDSMKLQFGPTENK